MSTIAATRQRTVNLLWKQAGTLLHRDLAGMSRRDAARWASARDMTALGELVIAWLGGEIRQTPGHCGPPNRETIPLVPVLTTVNRAGLLTDNSHRAGSRDDDTWNAWVQGF